jgi:hypothetical protein
VAVLLADLVFAGIVGHIELVTMAWLEHSDSRANSREGCLNSRDQALELAPADSATTTQYLPLPARRRQVLNENAFNDSSESQQRLVSSPYANVDRRTKGPV